MIEHMFDSLAAGLADTLAVDPDGLSDCELSDALQRLHEAEARLAAAKARLTAIMADKGYAYGKETGWLSARWGCSISWPVRASEGDCG